MKKKKLIERVNRYFSEEETEINIPPIESIQAYGEFHTLVEPPAAQPVRKPVWGIRRAVMIAACLAVVIAVAVGISASIGAPEDIEGGAQESNEGFTNKQPTNSLPPAASDAQEDLPGNPSIGNEGSEYEASESEGMDEPGENGNGMGGGWDDFEAYFPEELYNLYHLSYIVTWEEIYAAENKLLAENEYFQADQLPSLYLVIHELNISKEEFVRVNEKFKKLNEELHTEQDVYTDEQIEWLFSDADIQTIQAAFKLDTALLYHGRLYNPYELLELEDSLLRELANTEEMTAYLANLNDYWFADALKHRLEGFS